MPDLVHALRAVTRSLRPVTGATRNAHDAVRLDQQAAQARRAAALAGAHASGPSTWICHDQGSWPPQEQVRHAVDLYADDAELLSHLTAYVADGLAEGETCLVIATPEHRAGLRRRLALAGVDDLDGKQGGGRLLELDAEEVLRRFLRDEWPDPELFDLAVAEVLRTLVRWGARVRAFGEMVGILHARGLLLAALQLEKLWEQLQQELDFPLLCAYPLAGSPEQDDDVRQQVLGLHAHVVATAG